MNILKKLFKSPKENASGKNKLPVFLNTYQNLFDKLIAIGFIFSNAENGNVVAEFGTLKFEILTAEDIYILHEIYYQTCYDFKTTEKVSVIDIGLNVGFASLFFSNMQNVNKVYSFEPFSQTFAQAIKNINYNQIEKEKIIPQNFGLGKDNREEELEYCDLWKGSLGINGLNQFKKADNKIVKEKVAIKDVSEVFSNIIKENDTSFIFKIDCEGAEYEILERLKETNLLNIAKGYMIEWHFKGPETIISDLTNAGFNCMSLYYDERVSGMIYAFKK